MKIGQHFLKEFKRLKQWDGKKLPLNFIREVLFEYNRYELIQRQLKEVEKERMAA